MSLKVSTPIRFLFAIAVLGLFAETSEAHNAFKKRLEAKYENLKVTCNSCHVQDEKKTVRNEFGKLFYRKLADQNLTQKWRAFEVREEKKAFEAEVMVPAFNAALAEIIEMANEEDENYGELITAGQIPNMPIKEEEEEVEDEGEGSGNRGQRRR